MWFHNSSQGRKKYFSNGKKPFFFIKKLQCHKMKEIDSVSAISSTSRTLTALSSIWTGSLMSFQKMDVRSPDSKMTLYWSLQSGSSNQYRRFPWGKQSKTPSVSQRLSQQVPQNSIYLAGGSWSYQRMQLWGLTTKTSFSSEIKQFQLLDAAGWEHTINRWIIKVFWWCLILILNKKSFDIWFLKKKQTSFFQQTIYKALGNKQQSLPHTIKNIKKMLLKVYF